MTAMTPRKEWVVLRCANASTLRLAESLNAAGIESWAPSVTIERTKPRRKAKVKHTIPLMASWVFASAEHLDDLFEISNSPICPHPGFWVWKAADGQRLFPDRELDGLRVAERKGQPLVEAMKFADGDLVRSTNGGFEGLQGQVSYTKGRFTFVLFGSLMVQVETVALLPEANSQPVRKAA